MHGCGDFKLGSGEGFGLPYGHKPGRDDWEHLLGGSAVDKNKWAKEDKE